jgi:hypothetical protein
MRCASDERLNAERILGEIQAAIGAAGAALARHVALTRGIRPPPVRVDRDQASAWFETSVRPVGWALPPP